MTEQLTGDGGDGVITAFGSIWLLNNRIALIYRIAPPATGTDKSRA